MTAAPAPDEGEMPGEALARALRDAGMFERPDSPFVQRFLAALDAAGWALVPKVATEEMLGAFNSYAQCEGDDVPGYAAMLAARPR